MLPIEARIGTRLHAQALAPRLEFMGLDALTTFRALDAGHREGNPLLKSGNRPLMIAAKIATASASIYLTERLWKQNRKAAVLSMVITNVAMSMVVANNTRIGSRH